MIKHLVLSGGGPNNILQLGAMHHLWETGYINYDHLESVYSTSAGSLLGLTSVLKYDMNIVSDFFIKRPWDKVFSFKAEELLQMIENKGYVDVSFINEIIDTFLTAKNVSTDITFLELFNNTNVNFNVYSVKLSTFEKTVLNHINTPSMPVKTAILMSCALPPMFKPISYNGEYYLDGGMLCNYPINDCVLKYANIDEILGIHIQFVEDNYIKPFSDLVSMPDYMLMIVKILISNIQKQEYISTVNEVVIKTTNGAINIDSWKVLLDQEKKVELYNQGIEYGKEFLTKQNLKTDQECQHLA